MAQSKVPKFGAWESEDNVGYTVRFDTVRKGGNNPGGPIINPNDIQAHQNKAQTKQKQPEFGAWENAGEEKVPYTQYFENRGKGKVPSEPQMNYNVGPTQAVKKVEHTPIRQGNANTRPNNNVGGVKFVDNKQSPIHHGAAGRGGRGNGTNDGNRAAPMASRQRPQATAGPSPNRGGGGGGGGGGASVPVFGDWNTNPSQAEGYTVVFNKLQADKRNGNIPSVETTPSHHQYSPAQKQSKGGCFSWLFR